MPGGGRGPGEDRGSPDHPGGAGRESALIGLGSNLGDRADHLRRAADRLGRSPGVSLERISALRETSPVGKPEEGDLGGPYLNGALELLTDLEPRELLGLCQTVEAELGRTRSYPNAPRTVDLDLLLYGDRVIREPGLTVPHPRLLERGFVLEPLAEIAPRRRHPETGRTLEEHWLSWRALHAREP
jgi:2-amino-4-hydroxy-6-hydroxymethyldihydropteridine diphosphokinase